LFFKILFIIILIPVLELYLLILIGQFAGALNTIMLVIFTGIVGFWFAKKNGRTIISRLINTVKNNRVPAMEVIEGFFLLSGGLLLIMPGIISDLLGFFFVLNSTRKYFIFKYGKKIQESNFFNQLKNKLRDELIKKGHLKDI
jgi:UPF0716 protein FxsA